MQSGALRSWGAVGVEAVHCTSPSCRVDSSVGSRNSLIAYMSSKYLVSAGFTGISCLAGMVSVV